jgi:Trypsin
LTVVLGALYLKNGSEPNEPVEKRIRRVFTHRYVERTFQNDLAILELETTVQFRPYIVPICLPTASDGDFNGRKAVVAGWGKLEQSKESRDSLNGEIFKLKLTFRRRDTRLSLRSGRAHIDERGLSKHVYEIRPPEAYLRRIHLRWLRGRSKGRLWGTIT